MLKFKNISKTDYEALETKDNNTIYFVEDKIYKGSADYTNFLSLSGGAMTGNIEMQNRAITGAGALQAGSNSGAYSVVTPANIVSTSGGAAQTVISPNNIQVIDGSHQPTAISGNNVSAESVITSVLSVNTIQAKTGNVNGITVDDKLDANVLSEGGTELSSKYALRTNLSNYLPLTGGTMSGDIIMGSKVIVSSDSQERTYSGIAYTDNVSNLFSPYALMLQYSSQANEGLSNFFNTTLNFNSLIIDYIGNTDGSEPTLFNEFANIGVARNMSETLILKGDTDTEYPVACMNLSDGLNIGSIHITPYGIYNKTRTDDNVCQHTIKTGAIFNGHLYDNSYNIKPSVATYSLDPYMGLTCTTGGYDISVSNLGSQQIVKNATDTFFGLSDLGVHTHFEGTLYSLNNATTVNAQDVIISVNDTTITNSGLYYNVDLSKADDDNLSLGSLNGTVYVTPVKLSISGTFNDSIYYNDTLLATDVYYTKYLVDNTGITFNNYSSKSTATTYVTDKVVNGNSVSQPNRIVMNGASVDMYEKQVTYTYNREGTETQTGSYINIVKLNEQHDGTLTISNNSTNSVYGNTVNIINTTTLNAYQLTFDYKQTADGQTMQSTARFGIPGIESINNAPDYTSKFSATTNGIAFMSSIAGEDNSMASGSGGFFIEPVRPTGTVQHGYKITTKNWYIAADGSTNLRNTTMQQTIETMQSTITQLQAQIEELQQQLTVVKP